MMPSLAPTVLPDGNREVRINREVVGTVDQADEEGERFQATTLVVLEEDLSA